MTQLADDPRTEGLVRRDFPPAPRPVNIVTIVVMVALIVSATAAAAYFFSSRGEPIYGAQTKILYQSSASGGDLESELASQGFVFTSRNLLAPIASRNGIPVEALEEKIKVIVEGQSQVLTLTVADPDRETARRLGEAVSRGYVRSVGASGVANIQRGKDFLQRDITRVNGELTSVQRRLRAEQAANSGGTPSATQRRLEVQENGLTQSLLRLQDRLSELELREVTQGRARIITPAYGLPDQLEPRPKRAAAAGVLIGLLISAGAVALLVTLSRRRLS